MKNYQGLSQAEVQASWEKYGKNVVTPPPKTPWWKLYLEKFEDPIIKILLVALAISLVVGILEGHVTEVIGILTAILLATGVGFWLEYDAKGKFDILNQLSEGEPVKVIRDGIVQELPKDQLAVGDIVILAAGDEVPADINLYEATELKIEEAAMTGESKPASKKAMPEDDLPEWRESGFPDYLCLRSTKVTEGNGVGVIVAIGDATEIGKTTREAMVESEVVTPLNRQLDSLAGIISKVAFGLAALLLVSLNVYHFGFTEYDPSTLGIIKAVAMYFMAAVTLIVVAVPEGLPLASTLALAFSMKTMAKENNLVKKLHATETIGATTLIMTDKTGTLTQNKMTTVDIHTPVEGEGYNDVAKSVSINSTANLNGTEVVGNPTEGALLGWVNKSYEGGYSQFRNSAVIVEVKPFNSTDKYMSTTVKEGDTTIIHVKGAPEIISNIIGDESYLEEVKLQQARGRRAISVAIGETMETLIYKGTLFIEDPIREDVPEAVAKCYTAGVDVMMMTGDNLATALEIGRQSGINRTLQGGNADEIWAVEAKDYFDLAYKNGMGRPNVVARCTPSDKLAILKSEQARKEVCVMTGDGVNDSPSLNHSDVGIAMGSGTSVAKEAADIVLLNDAFPSIVTGIKWGRSLYKNIQSFLVFQLIINVATCLTVLAGPLLGINLPFTVTQMLWVNIVMDTLAAWCLASAPADEGVLLEKPRGYDDFIITKSMKNVIFGMGIGVAVILGIIIYNISHMESSFGISQTMMFAMFMMICWWNLFNIRVLGHNSSIFTGLGNNKNFLMGAIIILIGTFGIVQLGGEVFSTTPLTSDEWMRVILYTSPILIFRELYFQVRKLFRK